MARKKKAEVVEEITEAKTQPVVDQQEVKEEKPVNEIKDDGTIKVDLDKYTKKQEESKDIAKVDFSKQEPKEEPKEEPVKEVVEEVKEEVVEETPVVEEITEIEVEEKVEEVQEAVEEAVAEAQETGEPLPENIKKVVEFMNETGGTLNDYVKLNQEYDTLGLSLIHI